MVWFNEELRFRLCTATISGWFSWMPPCKASPLDPRQIPEVLTGIDGWKDPRQKQR